MNLKKQIIKYSKKLNSTNLSALRSGNISARVKEKGVDGFYITPSGMRYDDLKPSDGPKVYHCSELNIYSNVTIPIIGTSMERDKR